MWRSFFLATGLSSILLGVECLGVENMSLKIRQPPPAPQSRWDTPPEVGPPVTFAPPRWAPWSLMSAGAVVCLYSFTLPTRWQGSKK